MEIGRMDKNEEIVDVLEDKTIHDYITKYYEFQTKIEYMLSKLKNNGVECDCEYKELFIVEASFNEFQKICVDCGGYVE